MNFRKLFSIQYFFIVLIMLVMLSFGISKADTVDGVVPPVDPTPITAPAENISTVNNASSDTTVGTDVAPENNLTSSTSNTSTTPIILGTSTTETTATTSNTSTPPVMSGSTTASSSSNQSSDISNASTTQGLFGGIFDAAKSLGDKVGDAITGAINKITAAITRTSTPETIDEKISAIENASSTTAFVQVTEKDTDSGKLVTVSSPNESTSTPLVDVLASTTIPRIYKVGEESKIHIKWKNNGGKEMAFRATDTNGDGYLDLVEWIIPHLSTQTFEIIFVSKAFQLDSNQDIIADIYDTVKTKDGNFASLTNGQYIRVTFEKTLTNKNDNTIFAKAADSNSSASIEVYPVYKDADGNLTEGSKVATFSSITDTKIYRVLLKNLKTPTDIFDLKVVGNVDVDYVVDPTTFTAVQNGPINDGATYGLASPGTAGIDYPDVGDSVNLAGYSLSTGIVPVSVDSITDTVGNSLLDLTSNLTVSSPIIDIPMIVSGAGIILVASIDNSNKATGITINSGASLTIQGDVTNSSYNTGVQVNYGGILTDITGTFTNNGSYYGINNYGTITNISGVFNTSANNSGINNSGTITNIGGQFNVSGDSYSVGINNSGSGIIDNLTGTFTNTSIGNGYSIYNYGNINGGTYNGNSINLRGGSINGGTFSSGDIENRGCIQGGTFTGNTMTVTEGGTVGCSNTGTAEISNRVVVGYGTLSKGTFNWQVELNSNGNINGGTYNGDVVANS
ncbi:MAG: hypothetical protein WCO09_03970, partial [bacterium]